MRLKQNFLNSCWLLAFCALPATSLAGSEHQPKGASLPRIQLQGIKQDTNLADHALVILKVDESWSKGTGFQLLIDKDWMDNESGTMGDATLENFLYDTYSWNVLEETYMIYQGCDYFIPENATGQEDSPVVHAGEQDSVYIECNGSYYQYAIFEMTDEAMGYNAPECPPGYYDLYDYTNSYGGASYDGFEFNNGFVYLFTVLPDNVTRTATSVMGTPDLSVERVHLPSSSCALGMESVSATLRNSGKGDIYGFKASYSIDKGDAVEQFFQDTLHIGEEIRITFDSLADFSIPGHEYRVTVAASLLETASVPESDLDNNENYAHTTNSEPLYLPYISDFTNEMYGDHYWSSWIADSYEDEWMLSQGEWSAQQDHVPLVSPCFYIEKGLFRFSYTYQAGIDVGVVQQGCSYGIQMGKAEDNPFEFDTLWFAEEEFTQSRYVINSFVFEVEEDDHYAFAIQTFYLPTFYLQDIQIEKVDSYDLAVKELSLATPHRLPLRQLPESIPAAVELENLGSKDITYTLQFSANGQVLAQNVQDSLPALSNGTAETSLSGFPSIGIGDTMNLYVKGSINDSLDANIHNDTARSLFILSDTVMAYDRLDFDRSIVSAGAVGGDAPVWAGTVFNLARRDTLSSISLGLSYSTQKFNIGLAVYHWDAEKEIVGESLFDIEVERERESGLYTFPVPARSLDSGSYLFAFKQLGTQSANVLCDNMPGGLFYIFNSDTSVAQTQAGFLCLRANFGPAEIVAQRDAMLSGMEKPASRGIFTKTEEIVANVTNNGPQPLHNFQVLCIADKDSLYAVIDTLAPYAATTVSFTANLSAIGTHRLFFQTMLAEDENPANDTLTRTVECIEMPDPYFMDFEACQDFSQENFQSGWASIDRDNTGVCVIDEFMYPGWAEPCGFMAFNPYLTEPAMEAEGALPYDGQRYGASFSARGNVRNNDWLVSPKLQMPESGSHIEFYAKSLNDSYGLEVFNVLVSTTDLDPDNFALVLEEVEAPADDWTHFTADLSAYDKQEIYIAIQCVSLNAFVFMIDNIKVGKPGETGTENHRVQVDFSLYPNPARDRIYFRCEENILSVDIYSLDGRLMYSDKQLNQPQGAISVANLPQGLYLVQVRTAEGTGVQKFVKR